MGGWYSVTPSKDVTTTNHPAHFLVLLVRLVAAEAGKITHPAVSGSDDGRSGLLRRHSGLIPEHSSPY